MNIKNERDIKIGAIRLTVAFYGGKVHGKRYILSCKIDNRYTFTIVSAKTRDEALRHYVECAEILQSDDTEEQKIHNLRLHMRENRFVS